MMNGFEHNPEGIKVPESRTSFNFHKLMVYATRVLVNCPKFITIARHVALEEVTPLHCIEADTLKQIDLFVPRQGLHIKIGFEGLRYTVLHVNAKDKQRFLLVVCERNRQGLLLPHDFLDEAGNLVGLAATE